MSTSRQSRCAVEWLLKRWLKITRFSLALAAFALVTAIEQTDRAAAETPRPFNPSPSALKPIEQESTRAETGGFRSLRKARRHSKMELTASAASKSTSAAQNPNAEASDDVSIQQALFENDPGDRSDELNSLASNSNQMERRRRVLEAFGLVARAPGDPLEASAGDAQVAEQRAVDSESTADGNNNPDDDASLVAESNGPALRQPPSILKQFANAAEVAGQLPRDIRLPVERMQVSSKPHLLAQSSPQISSQPTQQQPNERQDFAFVMSLSDDEDTKPTTTPSQVVQPMGRPQKVSVFAGDQPVAQTASTEVEAQRQEDAAPTSPTSEPRIDFTAEGTEISLTPAPEETLSSSLPRPEVISVIPGHTTVPPAQTPAANPDDVASANEPRTFVDLDESAPEHRQDAALEAPVNSTITDDQTSEGVYPELDQESHEDSDLEIVVGPEEELAAAIAMNLESAAAIDIQLPEAPLGNSDPGIGNRAPPEIVSIKPFTRKQITDDNRRQISDDNRRQISDDNRRQISDDDPAQMVPAEIQDLTPSPPFFAQMNVDDDMATSEPSTIADALDESSTADLSTSENSFAATLPIETPAEVAEIARPVTQGVTIPEEPEMEPISETPPSLEPIDSDVPQPQVVNVDKSAVAAPKKQQDRKADVPAKTKVDAIPIAKATNSQAPEAQSESVASTKTDIEEPIEDPIIAPGEEPFSKPLVMPFEKPLAKQLDAPLVKPNDKPFVKPIDKPLGKQIEKPVAKSVLEPVDNPIAISIEKPIEKPKQKPSARPESTPVTPSNVGQPMIVANSDVSKPHPENTSLVSHRKVDMILRQTSAVRTNSEIERVAVVDPEICDVVQFAPDEAVVVAKHEGTTHVRLWFKGSDDSTNYLVTVSSPERAAQRANEEYDKLRKMIRQLYPDADVDLIPSGDRLLAKGTVTSEEQAIQILTLVRKVRLIPVVDQLMVDHSAPERRTIRR